MGKKDIEIGHATIEDLAYWVNERHRIYMLRLAGAEPPWTEDPILREFKFTNAFRELDKGTVALRKMLPILNEWLPERVLFNIIWYRMFNRYEHATDIGAVTDWEELNRGMRNLESHGKKLFTSAHMTVGRPGELKIDTMLTSLKRIWDEAQLFSLEVKECTRLQQVFDWLIEQNYMGIGPFIAYEIVTDIRHYGQFWSDGDPTDVNSWVNLGPGCVRGLQRLGYHCPSIEGVRKVYMDLAVYLESFVRVHLPKPEGRWIAGNDNIIRGARGIPPLFELREVEHSLCEFDKYQRVKTGVGKPRERYHYEQ